MITKERLEELIEQEALIFYILNNSVAFLRLNNSYGISVEEYNKEHNCKPQFYHSGFVYQNICDADKIFETEEDARWELEMTETRTETLKMPKWEEAQDEKFHFSYLINVKGLYLYISIYNFTKKFEIYCNHGTHTDDYKFDKTFDLRDKEQYETACKLCLQLFKGEEV